LVKHLSNLVFSPEEWRMVGAFRRNVRKNSFPIIDINGFGETALPYRKKLPNGG
jgi:hypothetical protein